MARRVSALRHDARARVRRMDAALERFYRTPTRALGNRKDPLEEAVYIILSFQTDLARLRATWVDLRARYPDWQLLLDSPATEVATVIRRGGLQVQKASRIKALLWAVQERVGELSLRCLRPMNDDDAERFLTRLPGLSWKGARCVTLYSLDRESFPVDGNTFRIFKRTGVISKSDVYRRRQLHDALQHVVAPERRKTFHINVVVHGQRTCTPSSPDCHICPIGGWCPRIGLPRPLPGLHRRQVATR